MRKDSAGKPLITGMPHPDVIRQALYAFNIDERAEVEPFGDGLINHTWKVCTAAGAYILQRVNQAVFKKPQDIAYNVRLIGNYLFQHAPDYRFVAPIASCSSTDLVYIKGGGYFRVFPFVNNSFTKNVVNTAEQAYEAARQFGKFIRHLSGFDAAALKITIPDFHNLSLRYREFLTAIETGNSKRAADSQPFINLLKKHVGIVSTYESIKNMPQFKLRVTHHDTKISNVLFDENDKSICVIDLDTVMPGYFTSDVGDMMRTYLSPASEEEQDLAKVYIREDFYKAIVDGYCEQMKGELTETEKAYFFYAGTFMIYMQALRFLTDHINNDVYYGARYEGQNLVRAKNQIALLEELLKKEKSLQYVGRKS